MVKERIELCVSSGRGYNPLKPKLPTLDSSFALKAYLAFMDTNKRMVRGKGSFRNGQISSHSNGRLDNFYIRDEVYDYILWENKIIEGKARREIIKELSDKF